MLTSAGCTLDRLGDEIVFARHYWRHIESTIAAMNQFSKKNAKGQNFCASAAACMHSLHRSESCALFFLVATLSTQLPPSYIALRCNRGGQVINWCVCVPATLAILSQWQSTHLLLLFYVVYLQSWWTFGNHCGCFSQGLWGFLLSDGGDDLRRVRKGHQRLRKRNLED